MYNWVNLLYSCAAEINTTVINTILQLREKKKKQLTFEWLFNPDKLILTSLPARRKWPHFPDEETESSELSLAWASG